MGAAAQSKETSQAKVTTLPYGPWVYERVVRRHYVYPFGLNRLSEYLHQWPTPDWWPRWMFNLACRVDRRLRMREARRTWELFHGLLAPSVWKVRRFDEDWSDQGDGITTYEVELDQHGVARGPSKRVGKRDEKDYLPADKQGSCWYLYPDQTSEGQPFVVASPTGFDVHGEPLIPKNADRLLSPLYKF